MAGTTIAVLSLCVDVARWYHEAKSYVPREWISRIDRDRLLETVCLNCGVILDRPASGDVTCSRCGATNHVRTREGFRIFASLTAAPA